MNARGLHHVTAIIGDVRRAADFYAGVLRLKRVKKTVCYDDPGSYHVYYGDDVGNPGTVMSTLAWNCVTPGLTGAGEVVQTAFRVAGDSLDWWADRLASAGVTYRSEVSPFGERTLCFSDPDGTALSLIETWEGRSGQADPNKADLALRGLHGVTLNVREEDETIDILQKVFDFQLVSQRNGAMRFVAHDGPGGTITLRMIGKSSRGRLGGGTIRHVAFRASNLDHRSEMVEKLRSVYGIVVSDPIERTYLNAVGFRAPCGVLFEIATDGPGFAVDEAPERLGQQLQLPSFLEERRAELAAILPPLA
ncbi:dioxygenase [Bradyrhizobium nitroreducens]|uniref:Dioxygenase n=1 Tax=Bradyrhizobium nitroreducens TaxID=709803 RepID=A0A2M6UJV3_9BRAD|nr:MULTISPECIES: ring-cleaving dioxygenase [Bradyrhizobium]PIT04787.1 dioxygenase [Bradyrhizobium nitroreducens]TQF39586.1 dioxygenase [Bradyrhizobium sp. UNPF46]